MSSSPDVIVVGGGPAGASVSRLLALWGRRVLLLTGGGGRRNDLAESLPPSIRKLLEVFHLMDAVEAEGFMPARGNTVWWTGAVGRRTRFEEGTGWQVSRRRLGALLLERAEAAGADVCRGAVVEAVELEGERPRVRFREHGRRDLEEESAPCVLDCSGRAGVVASGGFRIREADSRTTALIGAWRKPGGWDLDDETHTLVEGYRDGWAWSIPVDRATRYFTAMVEPGVSELRPGKGLEAMYRGELVKTSGLAPLLATAELVEGPWACGATPYSARRFGGPGFLLVGDAGSFIDPLSSYGVKKALASAWLASVVVNTLLDDPSMEKHAVDWFETRERMAYRSSRARAGDFYREGAAVHDHPFWHRRSEAGGGIVQQRMQRQGRAGNRALPWGTSAEAAVEWARSDSPVQAAFEALRDASEVRIRPAGITTLMRAPAVRGRRLVMQERLLTPSNPKGLRYLRGVDVVALIRVAATADDHRADVPDLYERYQQVAGPVSLPDFLGGLAVLLAEGVLENSAIRGEFSRAAIP